MKEIEMENIELAYGRIIQSVQKRSGVMLTLEDFNRGGNWIARGGNLKRKNGNYLVQRWAYPPCTTSESIAAGSLANYPLKAAKKACVEYFFLMEGRSIPLVASVAAAIEHRINEDTLLLDAIEQGRKVACHPHYEDAQYSTDLGFIHQSGGGRLTLCTEAEHRVWLEHYARVTG